VAPPVQRRSREKLERILAAAERLLEERVFEGVSMADLAREAGVSVGLVYTRFQNKEALLPALLQRHHGAVEGRLRALFATLGSRRRLRSRIQALAEFAVDYHRRHRGLLRALAIHARSNPGSIPARVFAEREAQYREVARALVADGAEVARRDKVRSAEFALRTINAVCREQILFEDSTLAPDEDAELRGELERMTHAYLTNRES
jgi:AcrR family transcriptional regulator